MDEADCDAPTKGHLPFAWGLTLCFPPIVVCSIGCNLVLPSSYKPIVELMMAEPDPQDPFPHAFEGKTRGLALPPLFFFPKERENQAQPRVNRA